MSDPFYKLFNGGPGSGRYPKGSGQPHTIPTTDNWRMYGAQGGFTGMDYVYRTPAGIYNYTITPRPTYDAHGVTGASYELNVFHHGKIVSIGRRGDEDDSHKFTTQAEARAAANLHARRLNA